MEANEQKPQEEKIGEEVKQEQELATTNEETVEKVSEIDDKTSSETVESSDSSEPTLNSENPDESLEEIDNENAEDAEDQENQARHTIPMPDYHSMSLENLVGELQRLVKNEKVQAINKHV